MVTITKSMIALSALLAAGAVAALDMSGATRPSAAAQVASRFPAENEMFKPVSMTSFTQKLIEQQIQTEGRKADRQPVTETCTRQEWPYLAQRCLVSKDGQSISKVHRIITVERRVGDSTSELVRLPITDLAQR
jgi:hypothetical protein